MLKYVLEFAVAVLASLHKVRDWLVGIEIDKSQEAHGSD